MTIAAVIGAHGFLGAQIAADLKARGVQVLAAGRGDALPEHADWVVDCNGDARRFYCNADPGHSFAANAASVMARLTGIRHQRYVYCSSVDVYGPDRADRRKNAEDAAIKPDGLDCYAFHKHLAEQLTAFHGRRPLILRLGTLIGPGLKKNPMFDAVNDLPLRVVDDSRLALIGTDTVCRALNVLLENEADGIWNVAPRTSIAAADMLDIIARRTGRTEPFRRHNETTDADYDVDVDKLSALMPLPDAAAEVERHFELVAAPTQAV